MKKLGFLGVLMAVLAVAPLASAVIVDEIVATVDDEVILRSDLMREIGIAMGGALNPSMSEAEMQAQVGQMMEQLLEQAIEGKLLYKEALLMGAEVDDRQVDERVQEIQKQYESYDAFLKALHDAGESMSDLRTQVRKQMLALSMAMSKRKQLIDQAVITEEEMRQFYQDNQSTFSRPDRVKVRRIFLTAPADPNERSKATARLEALRDEVAQGAKFGDLAKAHSEGPDADQSGLVGWVRRGDLVAELEEAAFATETGEMSAVVETEFGVHLLLVEEREAAGAATYEEMRSEIEPRLRTRHAEERYRRWMRDLRSRSRVQVFI